MLNKIVNAIMRNEKDPELNPIRITPDGYLECMSGILYGKFKLFEKGEHAINSDIYMNYKIFNSILYPSLSEDPTITLKNNVLNILSKESNLKINLSMPFDDYKKTLEELRDRLEEMNDKTDWIISGEDFKEYAYLLKENMKIAKSLSAYKDLNYLKITDGKILSFSPISMMAASTNFHTHIKSDVPGVLVDLILSSEPLFMEFAEEYIIVKYNEGEVICKKLTYDELEYKHFLEGLEKQGSIALDSIDKFWSMAQFIESSYWVKNLHIKGKYPNGYIMLKSPTANIKRKIKISSGMVDIKISPQIFKLIYKLGLSDISESDRVYTFMSENKDLIFVISKELEGEQL